MFKRFPTLYSLPVLTLVLLGVTGCAPVDDRPNSDASAFDLGGQDVAEDFGPDLDARAFADLCREITDMEECVAAGCAALEQEFRRYSETDGCSEPTTRTLCLPHSANNDISTCWWRELENGEFETFSDGSSLSAVDPEVWTLCSDEGEPHPACECNPVWGSPP